MNRYYEELCAEIEQDKGVQYDKELREEIVEYMLFENNDR